MGAPQPSTELPAISATVAAAASRQLAQRTVRLQGATDRVGPDASAEISRLAYAAANEWRHGGDSQSSLTTPPSRSANVGGVFGNGATDENMTTHTGLMQKVSNAFPSQQPDQHQVYIPPDGLDDDTTGLQNPAGPSEVALPHDDQRSAIQQALQMCDTDQIRESLGTPGGMAWRAARATDSTGAAPPGTGGYMKLEDVMNGRLSNEGGGLGYPVLGGPQAAIEPPDKVSVRYDQHSEAGIDTAFNVLLECFGMMQWQV